MNAKWNRQYRRISQAEEADGVLTVRFQNRDIARVDIRKVTPPNVSDANWRSVTVIEDGLLLHVPASPLPFNIPWDSIRRLTDPELARRLVELAALQAKHFGRRLRELREERGMSQAKVAEIAGLLPANLSRIENGQFDMASSTLWKVLAAMGATPADLGRPGDPYGS